MVGGWVGGLVKKNMTTYRKQWKKRANTTSGHFPEIGVGTDGAGAGRFH